MGRKIMSGLLAALCIAACDGRALPISSDGEDGGAQQKLPDLLQAPDLVPGCAGKKWEPQSVYCPPGAEPGRACDDGNACTFEDKCQEGGACKGTKAEQCAPCRTAADCCGVPFECTKGGRRFDFGPGCIEGVCESFSRPQPNGC